MLNINAQNGWSSINDYRYCHRPKELYPYQITAHFWVQEQWDEWEAWLLKQMGLK